MNIIHLTEQLKLLRATLEKDKRDAISHINSMIEPLSARFDDAIQRVDVLLGARPVEELPPSRLDTTPTLEREPVEEPTHSLFRRKKAAAS